MKVKHIFLMSMIAAILGIAITFAYAEDKVELKLNLQKGQSYKMQQLTDLKISQTVPGQQGQPQTMTIIQKSGNRNIYLVEDVQADSSLVLKVTHDAIFFKTENPMAGGKTEYDSTDTSTDVGPLASIFNAIVGQSFSIIITPDGHVKEVQGADELFKHIQEKINELSDAQTKAAMETSLKLQYSKESLKANTENSFDAYPDSPVAVGDTWQRRTALNQGLPMIINAIYTLKERKDDVAVIDIFAMIQPNREAGMMDMGSTKLYYNVSGSATGILEMQESTGWIIRSDQSLKLSGTIMVQSPQMQQPMYKI
ncbi:MAG: DUF6263 family protein, partial [Candidatus Ratteibacteria bacterium]|nr:DUF6263 family protein [Candidatus Ratteibacteria bacterium]